MLAFLAVFALWINRQVMDTDNWTETSSQMLADPAIRTAVSGYLVDQLYANVDVAGELQQALPPRFQPLAGPAASSLRTLAEDVADKALQRPRVQAGWEDANRAAHQALLVILEGGGPAVSTEGGVVKLDLGGLLQQLAERTGVGGRLSAKVQPGAAQIEILRSDRLGFAQNVATALRPLAILLLLLALGSYAGAVAVARGWRREALRLVGVGFIAAGVLALLGRVLAGDAIVGALAQTEAARPAAESAWRLGTSLLVEAATAAIGYGVVIVLAAWLAGRTRAAVATRRVLAPYLREPGYAYGAVALIVLLVLVWAPTPATRRVVPSLILIGLLIIGMEALRRLTKREFPDASQPQLGMALRRAFESLRGASGRTLQAAPAGQATGGEGSPPVQPTASAASTPSPSADPLAQLERLADLHERGVLSDEEFAAGKQKVLAPG